MKKQFIWRLTSKITVLVFAFLIPLSISAYVTERVVLVIIDGLRYSEGLGDPDHTWVPRMSGLAEEGAIVNDFQNDGATYTSRAIPAIWCGAWTDINSFSDPSCDGSNNNTTELPTIFEYYRKHLNRPQDDCIYTLKALCPWKASFDQNYGPDFWPLYHSVGYDDLDVWHETEDVIAQQSPRFLLMYLADVDHAGHVGNWDDYLTTIARADSIVGQLWDVLQADTAYAGKTSMFVTNDHGRHDYDFTGHGDGCDGCRHIQMLAIGPDIRVGLNSEIPRTIPDITPTIGELLGFATEQATGTVMHELLDPTVSIDVNQIPQRFELNIFPNPTNFGATIELTLSQPSHVILDVFDLSGRKVRTLQDNIQAGSQQLFWDGNNESGKPVSSGTYLLRTSSHSGAHFAKVVILK